MGEEETKTAEEAKTDEEAQIGEEEQESAASKNIVTIEEVGPCKKKVIIEIPEETIRESTDKQYEELRRDAIVPGFRKGRAPRRLLEKRFGKETSEQIKLKLLAEASEEAMKDLQAASGRIAEQWQDEKAREFDETFLEPLEPKVRAMLLAITEMAEVLAKAERACGSQ